MSTITPPPVLIKQWRDDWFENDRVEYSEYSYIAIQAAQWGADQELRAVCQLLFSDPSASYTLSELRASRRPKPTSLKQRALEAMHRNWNPHNNDDFATISRALEQLDD
jgi:hypothetical protein